MKAIFLDIETTGLDPFIHKPIDIAIKVVDLAMGRCVGEYQSLIFQEAGVWDLHDPVSLQINGYTPEDVESGIPPQQIRAAVIDLFQSLNIERGKAVFICQNPAFDRAFFIQLIDVYTQEKLRWPYHWLDLASMYWAGLVKDYGRQHLPLPESLSLSKNSIARHYHLPEEAHPHRAMQGVNHLISCYEKVLEIS